MALVLADRVRDTTTTTGTGTITLSGVAPNGYRTFSSGVGNGNTTYYTIASDTEWEVGIGTYTSSGTTLSRDTVLASSNSGSLVSFSAGTKDVFVTYPAGKSVYSDASGNVGIGTSAPQGRFDVTATGSGSKLFVGQYDSGSGGANINVYGQTFNYNNDGFGDGFYGGYARGTVGSPSAVQVGDELGYFGFSGFDGANWRSRAWIAGAVDGAVSSLSIPTAITFSTGPTSVTEKMRITSAGNVGIGTSSPAAKFDLNGGYCSNVTAVSASAIDCSLGNYFTKTASGALTWTFSNAPATRSYSFLLELTNGGTGTQTWPASVDWPGGTAPTLTTAGVDVLGFITDDGGTIWRGVMLMKDSK